MEKKLPQLIQDTLASFPVKQPLRLMFQDEARFGRISDCCYCWCKRPMRPLVKAMLSHQYVYAYAAVSPQDGKLDSLVLPEVNGQWMNEFLVEIASRYPHENIVMVVDGAGWHKSKRFAMPANLKLIFLPPYSPELNPQEHIWEELREKSFYNQTFDSLDLLEDHLVASLKVMEAQHDTIKSIAGWDWIIKAISNGNYNKKRHPRANERAPRRKTARSKKRHLQANERAPHRKTAKSKQKTSSTAAGSPSKQLTTQE